jgi:ectoine hydroxylase-related dioxygenase (phytanoyl-CoA dioxygenase family)
LSSRSQRVHNGNIPSEVAEKLAWVASETDALDVVLFDSFVFHFSARNASAASRKAMFITLTREVEGKHYESYYKEKRQNYEDRKFHIATPTLRFS